VWYKLSVGQGGLKRDILPLRINFLEVNAYSG